MIAIGDLPHNLNLARRDGVQTALVILPVPKGIPRLAVLICRVPARHNAARNLTSSFQPMSRPCVFRSKNSEANRYNDERRTRQNQERNADQ
jgi:hypothetical protein